MLSISLSQKIPDRPRHRSEKIKTAEQGPAPAVSRESQPLSRGVLYVLEIIEIYADRPHSTAMVTVFGSQPSAVKVTLISPASLPARTTAIT